MAIEADRIARRLRDRPRQRAVLHRPAVDEKVLVPPTRKGHRAARGIARQAQRARSRLAELELPEGRAAEDLEDPGPPIDRGRRVERLAPVRAQGKRDGVVRECCFGHGRRHRARLRLRGRQELAARRRPGEETLHEHVGPARARRELLGDRPAALDPQPDGLGRGAVGGRQRQLRDRCDRRQGLSAKPEGRHLQKVGVGRNLRRGVPLERKPRVLGGHSRAVVAHEDPVHAAPVHLHVDARGAGVEGVLDELFDRGGRALHDLASGDAVDDGALETVDAWHGRSVSPAPGAG